MPNLVPKAQLEIEKILEQAEERFEAGKRAYQSGDAGEARRDFDRALDLMLSAPENLPERHRLEAKMDEMVDAIYRFDLDHLGAGDSKEAIVYDKSPLETMLGLTFPVDPKLKLKVKEEIQATVSQLPLEENDTVLSYINFFSTERGRKVLLYGLKRAGRYKPLIQRILDEEGVPRELMSLAQAESAFMPRAVSNKKATGMWQFMSYTGGEYGLRAESSFDERLDPEKSTRAAARHLRDLYTMFGDWYLAMAAYNCGPNCVDRAVQRTGFADFWELSARKALPQQTMNYVPLILAMTVMSKNAADYGLENIDADRPLEYDTFSVTAPTGLDLIADAADRPVSELREMNPALLKPVAPAGFAVHVPKGMSNSVVAAVETVPEIHRASWRLHRVELGETLTAISKRFSASAEAIASANNRTVEAPEAGDLLVIPAAQVYERAVPRKAYAHYRVATAKRPVKAPTSSHVASRTLNHRAGPRVVKTAALLRKPLQ
jgi:membrane-bound lytic murein transglycosylase D